MVIVINGQIVNMFLKIERTGFSDGLDMISEKKREVKDDYKVVLFCFVSCLIQLNIDAIY